MQQKYLIKNKLKMREFDLIINNYSTFNIYLLFNNIVLLSKLSLNQFKIISKFFISKFIGEFSSLLLDLEQITG